MKKQAKRLTLKDDIFAIMVYTFDMRIRRPCGPALSFGHHVNEWIRDFASALEDASLDAYLRLLFTALRKLEPQTAEVYRAVPIALVDILKERYTKDAEICWPTLCFVTQDKRRAAEAAGAGGSILLLHTKSARSIADFCESAKQDIVLMPNTRFQVTTELCTVNIDDRLTCGLLELKEFVRADDSNPWGAESSDDDDDELNSWGAESSDHADDIKSSDI